MSEEGLQYNRISSQPDRFLFFNRTGFGKKNPDPDLKISFQNCNLICSDNNFKSFQLTIYYKIPNI